MPAGVKLRGATCIFWDRMAILDFWVPERRSLG